MTSDPRRRGRRAAPTLPYAELHAASAFSFLTGASLPEDLVARAAALEIPTVALVDRNGVYGAPRFYRAARAAGLKAVVGAEVALPSFDSPRKAAGAPRDAVAPRLTLLVANRTGYRNLCRLITQAACTHPKGEAETSWESLAEHAAGLHCLTGGAEGPLAHALAAGGVAAADALLDRLSALFPGALLHVELQRHRRRDEERRNQALLALARRRRLPLLATNGVRYAKRADKPLHDVLACIRNRTTLDAARGTLDAQSEHHFKGAAEMAALFADLPEAVAESGELAERLDFTLADLGYRFPDYPLPPGETRVVLPARAHLEGRPRPLPTARRQDAGAARERARCSSTSSTSPATSSSSGTSCASAEEQRILVQGRGSAANSAVCYALRITAVDPVKMELLFERFLSEERGEWPDIDLDLPSGDQREKVDPVRLPALRPERRRDDRQRHHLPHSLGDARRGESARLLTRAGGPPRQAPRRLRHDLVRDEPDWLATVLRAGGLRPRGAAGARLRRRLAAHPEPAAPPGQHSGGMVIAAGRLDEVVPLEPATMPGRVVVQWDKDDCADLGIIKVDLLGLGMLEAIEEMIPLIRTHEGIEVDLAHLPPDDPKVYAMMRAADTVGVFQVESRAQMASLPRNAPTTSTTSSSRWRSSARDRSSAA